VKDLQGATDSFWRTKGIEIDPDPRVQAKVRASKRFSEQPRVIGHDIPLKLLLAPPGGYVT